FFFFFFQNDLAASKLGTLIAGALGSLVFVFLLTALSNFQMFSLGKQVKAGLTEVFLCLMVAVISSATIHRVAITLSFKAMKSSHPQSARKMPREKCNSVINAQTKKKSQYL
ncbi:unnamed protein product, partial [Onchocerca flexuosa]|uniref:Dolichyl-diphosphooligosaccharide--protein glycosyltransferase subunit KCP2 n=1 Tax=Onchocerca flexuosa TaxID=387005 RepID=A0A183HR42_9BILA